MQHFVVHCVISSWTTCHKSACNCECECVSECESIQMSAHTRTYTPANDKCVFVCQTLSHCQSALWGFPHSCSCSCFFLAFCCCCCLWFCCFHCFFSSLCARHKLWATSNLHMYCHCYCHSICIYACRPAASPFISLSLALSLCPFAFSTPITLSWVKRSLCAVQPRICTFYGHVYGLQLIDYAWAEWTMPEMCKCSNAAHPLPALPAYIPPPVTSFPLSSNWNCMMTAQEAVPCPHQLLRLRSLFSCIAYPPGELIADCYSYPPPHPPPSGPSSLLCQRIRYEFYLLSVGILALIYRRLLFALLPAQQGAKYGNH